MRRKLLGAAFSMMAGIVSWYMGSYYAIIILAMALAGIYFLAGHLRAKAAFCLFCIVMYCAGCFLLMAQNATFDAGKSMDSDKGHAMIVKVQRIDRIEDEKYKLRCRVISVDGKPVEGPGRQHVMISYYHNIDNYWELTGRVLETFGKIEEPKSASNPGTFDYAVYLKTLKISHIANVESFRVTENGGGWDGVKRSVMRIREDFMGKLRCSDSEKSLIRGVLFGDIKSMDEDMYEDFKANGTAHVLAVSGLHVGVIFGIYRSLTKKRKSAVATACFIGFLGFYGTLTLWSVSVIRAVALVIVITLGDFLDRRYDLLTALGAVAVMVLVDNPWVLFSASFQMSFLAVVSISFLQPFFSRYLPESLSAVLAVQLGMMPYIAYVFNYVPLISFICNVPIVYLLSIIVPMGIGCLLITMVAGSCWFMGDILGGLSELMISVNGLLSQNGTFAAAVTSPPLWALALIYMLGFFFSSETFAVYYHRKNWKNVGRYFAAALIIAMIIFVKTDTPFNKADLVMVDVGQGDCLHIKDGRHTDMLIDGGGNINYNVGEKVLKPYLLKNGCSDIDLAMATHLHTDHYLGLKQLKGTFDVEKLLTTGKAGQIIRISDTCSIEILWPLEEGTESEDENYYSLIFKVKEKNMTILVTGDITSEGEAALLEQYKGSNKLKCDILKVCHHGSKYSSSDTFLDAVDPQIAVIGVGKNNYGHPSKEVIEKLCKKGIMVFRTDLNGAVGFIDRKGRIEVCVQRKVQ